MSKWFRAPTQSFYKHGSVDFINQSEALIIKNIIVSLDDNAPAIHVSLYGSGPTDDLLYSQLKFAKIMAKDFSDFPFECSFTIHDDLSLSGLIDFFQNINRQVDLEFFSAELIKEIEKIYLFIKNKNYRGYNFSASNREHLLPELLALKSEDQDLLKLIQPKAAPGRYNDDYRVSPITDYGLKLVKQSLTRGANPNQADSLGYHSLYFAVNPATKHIKLLKLLLYYGANLLQRIADPYIFRRDDRIEYISPMELAYKNYRNNPGAHGETYKIIEKHLNPIKTFLKYKVSNSDIFYRANQITTRFEFNDKEQIFASLKSNTKLSQHEYAEIMKLGLNTFELPNDPDRSKITKSIQNDLFKKGNYVEILRNSKAEIIGFTIFEFLPNVEEKTFILHASLAAMAEGYRQRGIFPILVFRLAYAFKLIFPADNKVGAVHLNINDTSFLWFKQFQHFSKYQTPETINMLKKLLDIILGKDQYKLTHDLMTCYVSDQIIVKNLNPTKRSLQSLQIEHFYKEILGLSTEQNTAGRAAPNFGYVSESDYQHYSHLCAELGINFSTHLTDLAISLASLLKTELGNTSTKQLTAPEHAFNKSTLFQPQLKHASLVKNDAIIVNSFQNSQL